MATAFAYRLRKRGRLCMQKHTPALEIKQETSFFFILWILRLQYDANTIYGILPTASPNFRLRPYVIMSMRLCNFRR